MTTIPTGTCTACGADTPDDRVPVPLGERSFVPRLICPPCQARQDREADEREAAADADHHRAVFVDRLTRSGLPKTFHGAQCTLDTLDRPGRVDALEAARRFAAGELRGLLLVGPVGIGKSSIAAAAAKRFMHDTGSIRWVRVHELASHLDLPFSDPLRAEAMRALSTPSARVLDDIDKTKPQVQAAMPLFAAVDRAVADELPLLVTANRDLGQLAKHWPEPFGVALASRLAGYCETWLLQGADRRRGHA